LEEGRGIIKSALIQKLLKLNCKVLKDETLSKHCSFKIGGPADWFVEIPREDALIEFLQNIDGGNFCILGGGTNVLFSDCGFRGTVVRLTDSFKEISVDNNEISSGAGAGLSDILQIALKNGLTGLECAAGIPGTVGGAVLGNVGSRNKWICEVVKSAEVYRNLKKEIISKKEIKFNYRESGLEDCVIVKVNFSLNKAKKNDNLNIIFDNAQSRLKTQPLNFPNAGSVFKNPKGAFAGELIEACGLKGKTIGGAQISNLHANFIVNIGGAKSEDVLDLIGLARQKVKEKFDITLDTEIKIIEQRF
jgi:UDP-N-acetylmuramate dehydrogenase